MSITHVEPYDTDYNCVYCGVHVTHYAYTGRVLERHPDQHQAAAYYLPCGHSNYAYDHGTSLSSAELTVALLMAENT